MAGARRQGILAKTPKSGHKLSFQANNGPSDLISIVLSRDHQWEPHPITNDLMTSKSLNTTPKMEEDIPVALNNCLYKLWTRVLTKMLSTFAESHRMLCSTQEGVQNSKTHSAAAAKHDQGDERHLAYWYKLYTV